MTTGAFHMWIQDDSNATVIYKKGNATDFQEITTECLTEGSTEGPVEAATVCDPPAKACDLVPESWS